MPRRLAIAVALVAGVVACAPVHAQPSTLDPTIDSVALGGSGHALIVLPDGYDTSGLSYPVVYFLHGLPAGPAAYRSLGWVAKAAPSPAIMVFPAGSRTGDTDPEYRNWGKGRNWQSFIVRDLRKFVDANYRTIANRRGRAIMGLSAGGYGAAAIGLANLDRYSVIESWSGYFHPTDPTGLKAIEAGPEANVHELISRLRSRPSFLGFFVGTGDDRFRDENEQLDRELSRAKIPHAFAEYAGGHETQLWRTHARAWLALALAHLIPAA
jgi:enterochelin esterase-like enzyme